jgi:beta-1,4-mannosyl-glycoprotein beta-1,4-N-acetylglucosaminyltransferase
MKIIDCFIFSNEVDLLKYRLAILNRVVDKFVIVEARQTFSGVAKDPSYEKNKKWFAQYSNKIIHILVDLPHKQPTINFANDEQWKNEHFQRNAIQQGLDQIVLEPDDYIIISDADEIPDPDNLQKVKDFDPGFEAVRLEQDYYYYNLSSRFVDRWYYSVMMKYSFYLTSNMTPQECRHAPKFGIFNKGGWHLSYFGDVSFIQKKIKSFSHQQYNTEPYNTAENIKECIKNTTDLFNRDKQFHSMVKIPISENDYLPPDCSTLLKPYCK